MFQRHTLVLRALLAALLMAAGISSAAGQLLPVRKDSRWGLIDQRGQLVAAPRYDAVQALEGGFTRIVLEGRFGLLDSNGRELIAPQFTFLKALSGALWATNLGGACEGGECEGGKWGIYNVRTQQQIPPTYSLILDSSAAGFLLANVGGDCDYRDCKGGRWALIGTDGGILLEPQYGRISPQNARQAFIQRNGRWGLFDLARNQSTIPAQFNRLAFVTPTTVAAFSGDSAALLSTKGDTLIGFQYQDFRDAARGLFQYKHQDVWGLIDSTGRVIIPAQFDRLLVANADWVKVWKSGQVGLYTVSGACVSPPIFREALVEPGRLALVSQGLAWGAITLDGRTVLPISHEKVGRTGDTLAYYYERNAVKWVDLSGKVVKGINYEQIAPFERGVAKVVSAGKTGLINQEGNWLIPMRFDEMNVFRNVAQARPLNGEWTYFYFDDEGRPSEVKRIIIMRNDAYEETANLATLRQNFGGGGNGGGINRPWRTTADVSDRWFYGSKRLIGLRDSRAGTVQISPRYTLVESVSRSDLYIVTGKIPNSETDAFGIVHYPSGRQTIEPMFKRIFAEDLQNGSVMRAQYQGRDLYTLIMPDGKNAGIAGSTYIRPFNAGRAAACVGGKVMSAREPRMDSIQSYMVEVRNSPEPVRQYDFVEGGKWGYLDTLGKWIHPAEYEQALPFRNGFAVVKKGGKWGVIDEQFTFVVRPEYDFVEELYTGDGKVLLSVGFLRSRYGFIDTLGNVAVKPQFQEAGTYFEGLARVRIDGLWGYADMDGNLVIPPRYRQASDFHEGRARVRNQRNWGYIDMQGTAITPERFLRAGDFHEGLAWVQVEGLMGYLGLDGQFVIPAAFTEAGDFSQGRARVRQRGGDGVIDPTGKWVLQPRYYKVLPFQDSLAIVQDGPARGIVRHDGTWLLRPRYKDLSAFSQGLASFRAGLEYGFIDTSGHEVISAEYANVRKFSCGLAAVMVKGRWGFIDTAGTMVIAPQFTDVRPFAEDRAAVRFGKKWGFIDRTGNLVIPTEYDQVVSFQSGRAAVQLSRHGWGFVNTDGTLVIPCAYDQVGIFRNGIVPVCKDRKWGVMNQYGALVTLMKYDQVGNYDQGLAKVNIQRAVGVVDSKGNVLVAPEYDSVRLIGKVIQVEANDALGYINLAGQWVWSPQK
jgi:WG containing repeat